MNLSNQVRESIYNQFGIETERLKFSLPAIVTKIENKVDLTLEETIFSMVSLMGEDIQPEMIAMYLKALHLKGESLDEIAISALVMRCFADKPYSKEIEQDFKSLDIIDCCGTGGGINLFNISTIVSLVLASGGLFVAKHGNRAITSKSGSADFLEHVGVKLNINQAKVGESILQTGIGFLFAPNFHKATKNVQKVRRSLPHKTIFNILGPLTNPAAPKYQVIGVYEKSLSLKLAAVLQKIKVKAGFVVYGFTKCGVGMDEVSIFDKTEVSELTVNNELTNYLFDPQDIGIKLRTIEEFPSFNTDMLNKVLLDIINGKGGGIIKDIINLNAAFSFLAAQKVKSLEEGVVLSDELISKGAPMKILKNLIKFTNKF